MIRDGTKSHRPDTVGGRLIRPASGLRGRGACDRAATSRHPGTNMSSSRFDPVRALANAPYVLLSMTALLWAVNMVIGRYVAGHVPPITLAFVRWVGATVILTPFAMGQLVRDLPMVRRNLPMLVLLAATGIASYNAMSYYGLQYTEAVNGLLVQSTTPLVVALWTFLIFRERLSFGQTAGILTSLIGVTLIISRGDPDTLMHMKPNIGDVWMLIAIAIYGFYAAMLRKRPPLGPLSFLWVIMALGAIILVPFVIHEMVQGKYLILDRVTISVIAYVMVGPSLIAYLCFNRGVELVGANRAAPFIHLLPVFGTALAIIFLGETVAWYHFAGYVLVIGGIVMATLSARTQVRRA